MILFNKICMWVSMIIILFLNVLPRKYKDIRVANQFFLLGLEFWSGLNYILLTIFGV